MTQHMCTAHVSKWCLSVLFRFSFLLRIFIEASLNVTLLVEASLLLYQDYYLEKTKLFQWKFSISASGKGYTNYTEKKFPPNQKEGRKPRVCFAELHALPVWKDPICTEELCCFSFLVSRPLLECCYPDGIKWVPGLFARFILKSHLKSSICIPAITDT